MIDCMASAPNSSSSRFLGSARVLAFCTLCSRFTGLARDMVMNRVYGQGWEQDAFNYGFLIPNLFRRLFGEGALSAVFVPVFTDVLDREGKPAAWVLLGRITGLMSLALVVLVVLLELTALGIATFMPDVSRLHIGLTALMTPFMPPTCRRRSNIIAFNGYLFQSFYDVRMSKCRIDESHRKFESREYASLIHDPVRRTLVD